MDFNGDLIWFNDLMVVSCDSIGDLVGFDGNPTEIQWDIES
jgi:hypothetical protein